MKIIFYNTKPYDRVSFEAANPAFEHEIHFLDCHLDSNTAELAQGYHAVCAFVNDTLDAQVLRRLSEFNVRLIALRCSGFNNVDLAVAQQLNLTVVRVPAYSPHAVAEYTIALLLGLNRKVHRAYNRIREGNFSLDGLLGFDLHGLTVGVIGTGKIGTNVIRILKGFGCHILAQDPYPNETCIQLGAEYVDLDALFSDADIISLHCPLTPESHHLINEAAIAKMKNGVTLLNTSRGALIDTKAVIAGLKSGKIGYLGLDVYEEEGDLFFEDLSSKVMQDDVFARLTTFSNVLVTGHQAFLTREALQNIANTTLKNVQDFEQTGKCSNSIGRELLR